MSKTVLITGASSGIGKATAKLFAQKGWNVVATMRDPAAEKELTQIQGVLVLRLDVTDAESIAGTIQDGIAQFGRIDALINNAGYGQYGLFEANSRTQIQRQFDVNVFGVMDVTRALLPHLRENQQGVIVNVSSGGGIFALPLTAIYCASKFALEGFSEALSYELAALNIQVKLVEPHGGVTSTNFGTQSLHAMAQDASLTAYTAFVTHMGATFASMSAASSVSAADVAQAIWEAATDGTDRLRYLVGNDARGFIRAKHELDDDAYMAFMRSYFQA